MASSPHTRSARPRDLGEVLPAGRLRDVVLVAAHLGAVKAAGAASIGVPGSRVPISAQSLAVVGGAIALGPVRATASSLAHGLLSTAGVRGFAPGHRATHGYVAGFLLAGPSVGYLAAQGKTARPAGAMAVAATGHAIILAAGAAHLHRHDPGRVWERGLRPFIPGAVVKSATIAVATPLVRRLGARLVRVTMLRFEVRTSAAKAAHQPRCATSCCVCGHDHYERSLL